MKERIKELRRALGLTQDAFGKQIGLSQNYIWMVEKGDRTFGDRVIDDICDLYNVNRLWLETGNGEMFRPLKQDEKLAEMIKAIDATDESSDGERFRRAVVMALARITPEQWEKIAKEANRLLDDFKT